MTHGLANVELKPDPDSELGPELVAACVVAGSFGGLICACSESRYAHCDAMALESDFPSTAS